MVGRWVRSVVMRFGCCQRIGLLWSAAPDGAVSFGMGPGRPLPVQDGLHDLVAAQADVPEQVIIQGVDLVRRSTVSSARQHRGDCDAEDSQRV